MPQIDLGQVVGAQGPQGIQGPQGAQGIQGPAGPAATINGVNALTIEAGANIDLAQEGGTATLSVLTDTVPTADSTKPVQSGGVLAALNNKVPSVEGVTGPASGVGWYRIAEVTISASRVVSFLVSIGHVYGNGGPSSLLASVTVTGYAYKITILDSSYYISYCIDNLRLMQLDDSTFALDIHYSITGSNDINSRFICGTAEPGDITPQAPTAVQNAPSGESLVALADWLNPPMQLGVEYRTAERYGGKPVYAKLVNLGTPTDGKSVSIGSDYLIEAKVIMVFPSYTLPSPELPYGAMANSLPSPYGSGFYTNKNEVILVCGNSLPEATAYARVKYTKEAP